MHVYLLFGISSICTALISVLRKKFEQGLTMDIPHFIMYNFINSIFGAIAFFIFIGGQLEMNMITMVYSVIFAFIIYTSLIFNIFALNCAPVVIVSMITTAGSIIISSLFGIIFLNEQLTLRLALSLVFMLTAVILPYSGVSGFKLNFKKSIILLLWFLISGLSVIILKVYTKTPDVCDSNQFFFMSNFLLIIGSGLALIFIKKRNNISVLKLFTIKQTANIGATTILSNIIEILQIMILTVMNISAYTVMSSSLALILSALLSKFYFKEHMPYTSWIALAFAVSAIAVNP